MGDMEGVAVGISSRSIEEMEAVAEGVSCMEIVDPADMMDRHYRNTNEGEKKKRITLLKEKKDKRRI